MKKGLIVAILAISTAAGCVSSERIMRNSMKKAHGMAAFADPVFSNPRYNEQYAIYKKLKNKFDRNGKLPVNWNEFEKCKLSTTEAARVVTPTKYKDPEKYAKMLAGIKNAAKNYKPKKVSLAKQARLANATSSGNSTERKETLIKAEVYALKGQCGNVAKLEKSKTRQVRIIFEKLATKTTVMINGKAYVKKHSMVNKQVTLYAGTGVDVTRNYNPEYKKNNPWKGWSSLSIHSTKSGSYNSNNLIYGYYFNNGTSISFSIIGGSISSNLRETLSGKRQKFIRYQGAKRTSVMRMKNGKRHGLQVRNGILGSGSTCFVNGVKSYKTDCERF